jgi:EAL domain-containing protein (putative c-di-GMP-specific phosphodiesterase class I)
VIREAGRRLAEWSAHAPLTMSANVSVPALYRPGYADTVRCALSDAFAPSALIVEVTETADLVGAPAALACLRAVKGLGVRIALDDFGTGYSSLASLAQLPVDILKIPRPFVATGAAHGSIDPSRMLTGIIALGRHLGLTTVAEGIETETQRDLVTSHGCDLGQGYLLGRPLEAHNAEALLRRDRHGSREGQDSHGSHESHGSNEGHDRHDSHDGRDSCLTVPAGDCAQARMGARASAP